MKNKDIAEKTLMAYDDVFSDILNVLLYEGKRIVLPKELQTIGVVSQYKADDANLHELERDEAKLWKKTGFQLTVFGLENQSKPDSDMPFRVIGYDGACYRSQLLKHRKKRYPVITLILYYGKRTWNKKALSDCLDVPTELRRYFNDYHINLFDISGLSPKQVKMFQSDFRFVADYFVQKRKKRKYMPPDGKIKHVDETLKLLRVITGDERFEQHFTTKQKKEGVGMCEIVDGFYNKGFKNGKLMTLYELVHDGILTKKEAAQRAGISVQAFSRGMKKAGY